MLPRERLLAEVWGWADASGTRTVDSHVKALRRKLGADLIRTVHGVGYALEAQRDLTLSWTCCPARSTRSLDQAQARPSCRRVGRRRPRRLLDRHRLDPAGDDGDRR